MLQHRKCDLLASQYTNREKVNGGDMRVLRYKLWGDDTVKQTHILLANKFGHSMCQLMFLWTGVKQESDQTNSSLGWFSYNFDNQNFVAKTFSQVWPKSHCLCSESAEWVNFHSTHFLWTRWKHQPFHTRNPSERYKKQLFQGQIERTAEIHLTCTVLTYFIS